MDLDALAQATKNSIDLTFKTLNQSVKQLSSADLTTLPNDIDSAIKAMEAAGISTRAFAEAIDSAVNINLLNRAAELSKSEDTDDKSTSVAFAILSKKSQEMGVSLTSLAESMSPADFANFAEEAGIIGPALKNGAQSVRLLAIEEKKRLEKEIPAQIIMMEKLARAEKLANSALNDFVSNFTRFSGAVTAGAQRFTNFTSSLDGFLDSLGGPQFEVRDTINPFENLDTSSFSELNNAVDRILSFAGEEGDGAGFEGIAEVIAVQKHFLMFLKTLLKKL